MVPKNFQYVKLNFSIIKACYIEKFDRIERWIEKSNMFN